MDTASEAAAEVGLPAVEPALAAGIPQPLPRHFGHGLRPPAARAKAKAAAYGRLERRWSEKLGTWPPASREDTSQVLRLLDNTRVPFTNNAAEKALRMVKLHDKTSGPFHSLAAAEAFAAVRSYLQTAANYKQNLLGTLRQLFTTGAWSPAPAVPGWTDGRLPPRPTRAPPPEPPPDAPPLRSGLSPKNCQTQCWPTKATTDITSVGGYVNVYVLCCVQRDGNSLLP